MVSRGALSTDNDVVDECTSAERIVECFVNRLLKFRRHGSEAAEAGEEKAGARGVVSSATDEVVVTHLPLHTLTSLTFFNGGSLFSWRLR